MAGKIKVEFRENVGISEIEEFLAQNSLSRMPLNGSNRTYDVLVEDPSRFMGIVSENIDSIIADARRYMDK